MRYVGRLVQPTHQQLSYVDGVMKLTLSAVLAIEALEKFELTKHIRDHRLYRKE